MIKVTSRAIISMEGKAIFATLRDGQPISLGMALLHSKLDLADITQVALAHGIEAADSSVREHLGKLFGRVDRIIGMDDYGGQVFHHYDVRGREVYYRRLEGWFPGSMDKSRKRFMRLSEHQIMDQAIVDRIDLIRFPDRPTGNQRGART